MILRHARCSVLSIGLALACCTSALAQNAFAQSVVAQSVPRTPIRHLVVIYQENVSFDHYFATYPHAANPDGEPAFVARADTPSVNTLASAGLLHQNPNALPPNGRDASLPFRLDRTQAATADQNHGYTAEQRAYDHGRADLFPRFTGRGLPGGVGAFGTRGEVMGYFDGNTVTAFWRYAQRFALSDATYTDTYGPSTPGAIEVVSGQTEGLQVVATTQTSNTRKKTSPFIADGQGGWTMVNDIDPADDVCSSKKNRVRMSSPNIGDLLNRHDVTWGGFMGGFDLSVKNPDGSTGCQRQTLSTVVGETITDYIPHHNWFQYYPSTANPTHARPSSLAAIGHTLTPGSSEPDPARHQYDLNDLYAVAKAGMLPAVSFVKMPALQDAHAGYSDPLDEQRGVVRLVNMLQTLPEWRDMAIIIAYDDSDGWYDHAFVPPTHGSSDPEADQLDGPGICGSAPRPEGVNGGPVNGRCGPGTRIPLIVISPWAKTNYVSHVFLTQASIPHFIEDNWLSGERLGHGSFDAAATSLDDLFDFHRKPNLKPLFLDPDNGAQLRHPLD